MSWVARQLCCLGFICLLQGCTTLGVELVDSAELAELKNNAAPAEETIDEAELDDALSRMVADLERQLEEAAALAQDDAVAADGTYVVKKGDYLDKIINQTVGSSPLRRDILRRAFVRANPHAFMRSNPNWLLANKRLRVPEADDIKKVIFTDESRRASKQRESANPHAGWIQYP
jgi:Tfp pilus assembly protein FimV|tara:strand:+ start:283 stop:807 length:525 start_codon:yes stop_codon:yes gene_type:complete